MNRTLMKNQHAKQATTAIALFLMVAQRIYAVSATALNEVSHNSETESSGCPDGLLSAEAHHSTEGEGNFWVNLSVVLFCTCASGLMSGLTIGLAAIDRLALEVDAIGNREVKNMTERIFPVIDQHHWMLVTLLLCNACAMETLPIFLDRMVSPVVAIFISVSLVLVFGEVIPQAICTGPNQLTIAYWMCPLVLTLMWCTAPVSWPIARILDIWLGEHTFQRYDNDQLKKLVMLHSQQALGRINSHHLPEGIDGLTQDQARMIEGAITFQQEPCEEVMTKISKVTFTLTLDSIVTAETLNLIRDNGYSRIPIVETEGEQNTIIAFLLSKSLVGLEIKERKTLGELYIDRAVQLKIPLYLDKATTLGKMIKQFQQGHAHMAVVCNSQEGASELRERAEKIINNMTIKAADSSMTESQDIDQSVLDLNKEVLGIVTLENVIERILLSEIHDERDREVLVQGLRSKQTIMFDDKKQKSIDSDGEIFHHSQRVTSYYNTLLDDVKKSIQQFKADNVVDEVKISIPNLARVGIGSKDHQKSRRFSSGDYEMPMLASKNSRS